MHERTTCPVCSARGTPVESKIGGWRPRPYRLATCATCGAGWVVDSDDDYGAIYDDAYYRGDGADPLVDYVAELEDPATARQYEWDGLTRIARDLGVPAGARWVDYGGGAGGFARALRGAGYDAWAYDSGAGIELARAHGVPTIDEPGLPAFAGTCDVVSAIEVAEHVADPIALFRELARLLRPGGLLLITTGNMSRHRGPLHTWSYVMPEVHITFYTPQTLEYVYRAVGLEPVRAARSPGWNGVVRYKVLKSLGVKSAGGIEQLAPWGVLAPMIDWTRGVSAMPLARMPR